MKVSYEREVIIITGDYKNQRIRMGGEVEATQPTDISDKHSHTVSLLRDLSDFIDRELATKVVSIKHAINVGKRTAEQREALREEGFVDENF